MASVGYEFLRDKLALPVFAIAKPAVTGRVVGKTLFNGRLVVPSSAAPETDDTLAHLLFALKHEGVNLQVLALALPTVPAVQLQQLIDKSPNGQYGRIVCYFWEKFTEKSLGNSPSVTARYVSVFDEKRYVTGWSRRDARWRVDFNGLGSPHYCVTVERTAAVESGIHANVLGRVAQFASNMGTHMMDRALSWAYLHETEDSYAIEREAPTQNKANAFIALLKQAHEGRALSEDYLVELQSSVITNPLEKAHQFRHQQNWLRGALRGASGITYVPPPPEMVEELMAEWLTFANTSPLHVDPLVAASISSFGFVFIHPFMDGNGRLSRFLFHKALCDSGQLGAGMLLPVSVAMKREEGEYLRTLQSYSVAAREWVNVTWTDGDDYRFECKGKGVCFRYWDATPCVEFGFKMAEQALEVELRRETEFLANFDAVKRTVEAEHDIRGSVLATLISTCLEAQGVISKAKRKRFESSANSMAFDFIEQATKDVLNKESGLR
jgi:hypothetical protein